MHMLRRYKVTPTTSKSLNTTIGAFIFGTVFGVCYTRTLISNHKIALVICVARNFRTPHSTRSEGKPLHKTLQAPRKKRPKLAINQARERCKAYENTMHRMQLEKSPTPEP